MALVQALLSTFLFCLPLILFVALSREKGNMLYLLFPLFGALPAIIGALLLFEPIEAFLERRDKDGLANLLIPAVGAMLPLLFMLIMVAFSGGLGRLFGRLKSRNSTQFLAAISVWGLLGAIWGGLWRVSGWLLGA